jgi:hypothetical protein
VGTSGQANRAAEPTWDGADWYGPVSGTYWTVNPREYADPRKHGPEYLARTSSVRAQDDAGRRPPGEDAPSAPRDDAARATRASVAPAAMGRIRVPRENLARRLERLIAAARGRLVRRPWRAGH